MAVTDLTNTKWLLNETLGTTTPNGRPYDYGIDHKYNEDYSINFTNGSINYTSFDFRGMGEGSSTVLEYTGTGVYLLVASLSADYAWWEDEAYKTIEITGGTDATNSNLISWLTSNATQIEEPTQSNYLEIYSNDERATHYKIYANGVLVATLPRVNVTQEGSEITVLSAPATQSGIEVTLG